MVRLKGLSDFSCKDCSKRFPGCHSTCEQYIEDKKNWMEKKVWLRKSNPSFMTASTKTINGFYKSGILNKDYGT